MLLVFDSTPVVVWQYNLLVDKRIEVRLYRTFALFSCDGTRKNQYTLYSPDRIYAHRVQIQIQFRIKKKRVGKMHFIFLYGHDYENGPGHVEEDNGIVGCRTLQFYE